MLVPVSPLEDRRVAAFPRGAAGRGAWFPVLSDSPWIESSLGNEEPTCRGVVDDSAEASPARSERSGERLSSLIVVVTSDLYVLQHGNRIVGKNRYREVQAQEVLCDAALVNSLVADGEARYI